jgi:hypothetical protein
LAGELITSPWQVEYRGVLLGDGTPYELISIEGLKALPDVFTADRQRLRRHGLAPGDDFLGGRTVIVTAEAWHDESDREERLAALSTLSASVGQEDPLVFQLPGVAGGGTRRIGARLRRFATPLDLQYVHGVPVAVLEFHADDPYIYDNLLQSQSAPLPSAPEGFTFPLTFPLSFGLASTGGTCIVTNEGNAPVAPVFYVYGPVTNPRIENVTTGHVLGLTGTIDANDYYVIDVSTRTILANGQVNRYNALTSPQWFDLAPGENDLNYRGATYSSDSLITVSWRSAWTS